MATEENGLRYNLFRCDIPQLNVGINRSDSVITVEATSLVNRGQLISFPYSRGKKSCTVIRLHSRRWGYNFNLSRERKRLSSRKLD